MRRMREIWAESIGYLASAIARSRWSRVLFLGLPATAAIVFCAKLGFDRAGVPAASVRETPVAIMKPSSFQARNHARPDEAMPAGRSIPPRARVVASGSIEPERLGARAVSSGTQRVAEALPAATPEGGLDPSDEGVEAPRGHRACGRETVAWGAADIAAADWARVMREYHAAKRILGRLADRAGNAALRKSIAESRILRPGPHSDPDLLWRGILAWGRESSGRRVLQAGAGFVRLARKDPKRARFELTRALIQGQDFCSSELETVFRGKGAIPACREAEPMTSAWARSTAFALAAVDPGCQVPGARKPAGRRE